MPAVDSKKLFDDLKAEYGQEAIELAIKYSLPDSSKSEIEKAKEDKETLEKAKKVCQGVGVAVGTYYATAGCLGSTVLAPVAPLCGIIGGALGGFLGGAIFDGVRNLFGGYTPQNPFCTNLITAHAKHCDTVINYWRDHGQKDLVENLFSMWNCMNEKGVINGDFKTAFKTGDGKDNILRYNLIFPHVSGNEPCLLDWCTYQPLRFSYWVLIQDNGPKLYQKLKDGDAAALECAKISPKALSYVLYVSLGVEETIKKGNYLKFDSGEINWGGLATGEGIGGNKALEIEAINTSFAELEKKFEGDYKKILADFGVYLKDEKDEKSSWWWLIGGGIGLFLIGLIVYFSKKKTKAAA